MNVLLVGSGGRESALAYKISKSTKINKLFILPGNAGTAMLGENVALNMNDFKSIGSFILEKDVNMVVIGPEEPLVKGIHDYFIKSDELRHVPVVGPVKEGAKLEGSKEFSKKFMQQYNIPTAAYETFTANNLEQGYSFLEKINPPYVLKADGLAAGKGVLILQDLEQAKDELKNMVTGKFGDASKTVIIEEFLEGIELSVFVITDGNSYKILPEAKDYKRIGEGDTGLNTGGMGAVSPVPFAGEIFMKKVEEKIIIPTIKGLQKENIPYQGFIFFGLIKIKNEPFVIEYNVRLGDPEAEVVLPRIKNDIMELLEAVTNKNLDNVTLETDDQTAVTVMLVSGGYPGDYEKGKQIYHLGQVKDSLVFHAGTRLDKNMAVTSGGRVLAITSLGRNMEEALKKTYKNCRVIDFEGKYYRGDIGFDL